MTTDPNSPERAAPPASAGGATGSRRDTAEACRERAAADLLASASMITANQRLRLEASAASWTVRADMLKGIEDGSARRAAEVAAARALRDGGDEPAAERG